MSAPTLQRTALATIVTDLRAGVVELDRVAQRLFDQPAVMTLEFEDESRTTWDQYDPKTFRPLRLEDTPGFRGHREEYEGQVALWAPPGRPPRWLSWSAMHIRDVVGDVVGVLYTIEDVSARWLADDPHTFVMSGDFVGRIWCDKTAQEFFGVSGDQLVIDPEQWAAAFHAYDPRTGYRLTAEQLPAYRVMREGVVTNDALLIRVPGQDDRYITVDAWCSYDQNGDAVGVFLTCRDATQEWTARLAEQQEFIGTEVDLVCGTTLRLPRSIPDDDVKELARAHFRECAHCSFVLG